MRRTICFVLILSAARLLLSQPAAPRFNSVPAIDLDTTGPVIRAHTEALKVVLHGSQRSDGAAGRAGEAVAAAR